MFFKNILFFIQLLTDKQVFYIFILKNINYFKKQL